MCHHQNELLFLHDVYDNYTLPGPVGVTVRRHVHNTSIITAYKISLAEPDCFPQEKHLHGAFCADIHLV